MSPSIGGARRNGCQTGQARLPVIIHQRQRDTGVIADPRQAQIARLKADDAALRERLADQGARIAELTAFRTAAVSQMAAQYEEIRRLRQKITGCGNVRVPHSKPDEAGQ
jgi:hypothetical protein